MEPVPIEITVVLNPTGNPLGTVRVEPDVAFHVITLPLSDASREYVVPVRELMALEVIRYPPSDAGADANVAPEETNNVLEVIPEFIT